METKAITRRYDLDWLRVMGILTVFIYHSGRFFNSETWHVKNANTYFGVDVWETILSNWMMPLIFAISGASLFYALGKGRPGQFIKDKVLRLLVPLLFGAVTLGALQMYLERLSHGEFSGSFFQFLPHYFNGLDGFGGNFVWTGVHLWYLEMLFIFSLAMLPLFLWLKRGSGQRALVTLGDWLARPGAAYLLALPVMLLIGLMNRNTFLGSLGWGGGSIFSHLCFFLSGFVIVSHAGLQNSIQRLRWISLALVVVLLVTIFALYMLVGDPAFGTVQYTLFFSLYGLWSWCWVLAILGFGLKHLNFSTPALGHANEAVLPFYILHQPVLLCVGFFVVRWAIPDLLKWAIIMPTSFVIIVTLYEFLVRRFNVMRVLFGMKLLKQAAPVATRPTQPATGKA
jgi:peptidoglycan/LPS O-acetylase OafA/YrhL